MTMDNFCEGCKDALDVEQSICRLESAKNKKKRESSDHCDLPISDSLMDFVEKEIISIKYDDSSEDFVSERQIIDDFQINLSATDGRDLTLVVSCTNSDNQRVLYVHSIILRSKSDFFHCCLSSRWQTKESTKVHLPLPNSLNYFENIILYLYGSDLRLNKKNVWVYYCLADYYLIPSLKSLCLQFWLKFLENQVKNDCRVIEKFINIPDSSYLSDNDIINIVKYTDNPLKSTAAQNLMTRFGMQLQNKKLLNSQLRSLPSDVFALMLSSTNTPLNEEELLKLALYWLTLQFKTKKLSRIIVENILSKIRYDLLSKECLTKLAENPSIKYHFTKSDILKNCLITACLRKQKHIELL